MNCGETNKVLVLLTWTCVCLIFLLNVNTASGFSPLWDSVETIIYQEYDVQEGNDILTVRVNMGEYKSTDLVVGEEIRKDARLIFTCIAHHGPAEWVYSGDGSPKYVKNSTVENVSSHNGKRLNKNRNDLNGAKRYVATLTLGDTGTMTTKDTGRYNCMTASPETGMKYKTLSAFYHVYVPAKNKLFARKSETVYFDLNKSAARIPCGVNNPRASVTLQKFSQGNLQFIPTDTMLYHPISGFYPKKDIGGTYLCTAAYEDTIDFAYFKMIPSTDAKQIKGQGRKPGGPSKFSSHEDMQWLSHPSVKKVRPTSPPKSSSSSHSAKRPSYVPYHLRYTSTTYGPFQTFYSVETTTTPRPSRTKRTTVKSKPFNPSKYPSELYTTTRRTTTTTANPVDDDGTNESDGTNETDEDVEDALSIPEELISYKPAFNYIKDTLKPKTSKRPLFKPTQSSFNFGGRRTTPRKWRPPPPTEIPIVLPESVVCAHYACGKNALCYANMAYNQTMRLINAEPACKCNPQFLGNPYLECFKKPEVIDSSILFFNLSSLGRSPVLKDPIFSEGGNNTDDNESESKTQEDGAKSTVGIIDM